jgi:hypothetical protein
VLEVVVLVDVGEVVVVLVLVGDVVVLVEVEVGEVVVDVLVEVDVGEVVVDVLVEEVVVFGGHTTLTSFDDQRSPARPSDATPYQRVAPGTAGGLKCVTFPISR